MTSAPHRARFALLFALAALLLYVATLWPLPMHFADAVPHADFATSAQPTPAVSGDHLQLLYHFWLGHDVLAGHTPPFSNVYEFNLGDDASRVQPDLYYLPFSLVFIALYPLLGPAAAWNAAGLASFLLGIFFLYLLARRFAPGPYRLPAALAALVAASLPYRFITLACGSPTGFAIALPPLLVYGLDRAIRDRSALGWALVVLALFCAYAADLHVFYFSALAAPFFVLLSLSAGTAAPREWPSAALRSARPLLPVLPLAMLLLGAIAYVAFLAHRHLADSAMHAGRTLFEMAAYSPARDGVFNPDAAGMARHVYFGLPLAILLVLAPLLALRTPRWNPDAPRLRRLAAVLLVLAILATVLLALGINAPPVGLWARAARKVVPKFTMIRQTVKVYCLLPAFVAPLLAMAASTLLAPRNKAQTAALPRPTRLLSRLAPAFVVLFSLLVVLGNIGHVRPELTRLPERAPALDAVLADAARDVNAAPQAIAIPIWPGDSHWSSYYEFDSTLSRIRFLNGYSPAAPARYADDVFHRYESINQGIVTDDQLDALLSVGCRYLLYYPHAFPDKVSPWPKALTLRTLLASPRLKPLDNAAPASDDAPPTLAFRILTAHEAAAPAARTAFAARPNWPLDHPYAAALHFLYPAPVDLAHIQSLKFRSPIFDHPDARLELLLDAPESVHAIPVAETNDLSAAVTPAPSAIPGWSTVPLASPYGERLVADDAQSFLHHAYLAAGPAWAPDADGAYHFQPALLWHDGRSTPGIPDVSFPTATTAGPGLVLHGPDLPIPPGTYVPVVRHSPVTQPDAATVLFRHFRATDNLSAAILQPGATETRLPPVTLDAPVRPVRFELHFSAAYADEPAPFVLHDLLLVPAAN